MKNNRKRKKNHITYNFNDASVAISIYLAAIAADDVILFEQDFTYLQKNWRDKKKLKLKN